jgi:hypothetical protein
VATDTWGVEVRPNNCDDANQPWHWICIPIMGLTMGEIFKLDELAKACHADKVYDFMFVGPALPITGAVGSPINPIAIRCRSKRDLATTAVVASRPKIFAQTKASKNNAVQASTAQGETPC